MLRYILVKFPAKFITLKDEMKKLVIDLHAKGQSFSTAKRLVVQGSMVASMSILGLIGLGYMHPDRGIMNEVVYNLPNLFHVNAEVDTVGTIKLFKFLS